MALVAGSSRPDPDRPSRIGHPDNQWIYALPARDAQVILNCLELTREFGDQQDKDQASALADRIVRLHPTAGKDPADRPLGEIDT